MVHIGICFSRELQGETPLAHIITKLPVYIRLFELMTKEGWNTYALTTKTYKGSGIFEGGWRFEKGKFYLTKDVLKIDLVYDKTSGVAFPFENDSLSPRLSPMLGSVWLINNTLFFINQKIWLAIFTAETLNRRAILKKIKK